MDLNQIDKIELEYLQKEDYPKLKELMQSSYPSMPDSYWKEHHIEKLIRIFRDGQVAVKVNGDLVGCALSIIVDYSKFDDDHTYRKITSNYSFDSHTDKGDALYGIDVFI